MNLTQVGQPLAFISNSTSFNPVLPFINDTDILKHSPALLKNPISNGMELNYSLLNNEVIIQVTNNSIVTTFPNTIHQSYEELKLLPVDSNWPRQVRVNGEPLPEPLLNFSGVQEFLIVVQSVESHIVDYSLQPVVNWFLKIRHPQNSNQLLEWRERFLTEILGNYLEWMIKEGVKPTKDRQKISINTLTNDDFLELLNTTMKFEFKAPKNFDVESNANSEVPYNLWRYDIIIAPRKVDEKITAIERRVMSSLRGILWTGFLFVFVRRLLLFLRGV
jgi:hypothetical protein